MTNPLSEEELRPLEALHAKATPGPWEVVGPHYDVYAAWDSPLGLSYICQSSQSQGMRREANAHLIVATKNAFPALLATIRALTARAEAAEAENARLREAISAPEQMFPIMGCHAIPWSLIAPYEAQARKNHGQTLKRLAERGGLGIAEAMAVMTSADFRSRPIAKPTVEDWLDFIAARQARAKARKALGGGNDE